MSKGLEALERLCNNNAIDRKIDKEDLSAVEKELKALEIIKNKKVNLQVFANINKNTPYVFYLKHHNNIWYGMSSNEFNEEEFELLKEVLL